MICAYGTYVPTHPDAPRELREEVARAEDAGFDAIFFSEHHGVEGYAPDPLSLAVHALASTSTMRAGTMPLLLAMRDPTLVAETAALANFISGGRLILGVGAGYLEQDYTQVGVPFAERGPRLEEAIALLTRTWAGPVEHSGQFFGARRSREPLHRAAAPPPLWIASSSRVGMRRSARLADGVMLNSLLASDEVAQLVRVYRKACAQSGRPAGTVGAIRRVWFGTGDSADAFLRTFEDQLRRAVNFAEYAKKPWVRDLASRAWVQDVVFVGDAGAVAHDLSEWAARVGVDYVMLKLHWGTRDFAQILEQLRHAKAFSASVAGVAG
jgi:alkanesulfonate monooxygenase SsuD/methylene tetrahydromethanopterin reductase-like flavin-dependent oxidoreductase (luciferase family)